MIYKKVRKIIALSLVFVMSVLACNFTLVANNQDYIEQGTDITCQKQALQYLHLFFPDADLSNFVFYGTVIENNSEKLMLNATQEYSTSSSVWTGWIPVFSTRVFVSLTIVNNWIDSYWIGFVPNFDVDSTNHGRLLDVMWTHKFLPGGWWYRIVLDGAGGADIVLMGKW
jgi:hypothetical protein